MKDSLGLAREYLLTINKSVDGQDNSMDVVRILQIKVSKSPSKTKPLIGLTTHLGHLKCVANFCHQAKLASNDKKELLPVFPS